MIEVHIPIKTVAGLNAREHWAKRMKRVKKEREAASLVVPRYSLPCVVTMIRRSSGHLDDDNLLGSLKAIRDGIADKLGVEDNDPRVSWRYDQEKCQRGDFGVRVKLE